MEKKTIVTDFDGVLGDDQDLRKKVISDEFNFCLTKDNPGEQKNLILRQNRIDIIDLVYCSEKYGLQMELFPNAAEAIKELAKYYRIAIVSSRGGGAVDIAEKLLIKWRLFPFIYDFIGVSSNHKLPTVQKLNGQAFVDDHLHKIEPMVGIIPNLFWCDNQRTRSQQNLNQNNITTVNNLLEVKKSLLKTRSAPV